jgi:hypothetical protein
MYAGRNGIGTGGLEYRQYRRIQVLVAPVSTIQSGISFKSAAIQDFLSFFPFLFYTLPNPPLVMDMHRPLPELLVIPHHHPHPPVCARCRLATQPRALRALAAFLPLAMLLIIELLPPQLLCPLRRSAPLLRRALIRHPVLADSMLLAVQDVDPAERERQRLVAHIPLEAVLAKEHDPLHQGRAVALAQAALNVLLHVGVQAGGRAAVVRGRGEALGEGDGVEERAVRAPAQRVAHVEDGVAEEGDGLRGPGANDLALAHGGHVGRVRAGHLGELGEARVDAGCGGALDDLGLELGRGEAVGGAAAVVEVRDGGADAEHDVGLLRLDGEGCIACCEGDERVLPGGEHDVLVVWAEGLVMVSFMPV